LLNSTAKLIAVKKPAIPEIKKALETQGIAATLKTYDELKKDKAAYEFDENAINTLGYTYLGIGKTAEALVVFKINVEEFSKSFNAYDSYGEALMKDGQKEAAIVNYKKSLELNPANTNATDVLAKMGVAQPVKEVTVEESTLAIYVGVYELAPNFTITITKTGTQLFAQATGQEKFELFAKSISEFFLKVVAAQIAFSAKDGKVDSLTLYQGGKETLGKRIK